MAERAVASNTEAAQVRILAKINGAVVLFGSAQNLDRLGDDVPSYASQRAPARRRPLRRGRSRCNAINDPATRVRGTEGVCAASSTRSRDAGRAVLARVRDQAVSCLPGGVGRAPRELRVPCPILTARQLITAGVLDRTEVVAWSLWEGYLKMPSGAALQELLAEHQISLTSVHASVFDLRRLVEALGPKRVVPIRSDAGDRFCEFFPRVERHAVGEWWQAGSK